ncbi:MAG: ATP-binding protein [Alphaproteobacteria bacterium]|nr:ATP-binding protein [Alphaproteobacteria bacterium]
MAFGIGLIMSLVQLFWDYQSERRVLDDRMRRILEVAEPPAARAVHILDEDLAEEVVNGLMKYEFIAEARIFDDLSIELAGSAKPPEESPTRWITKSIAAEKIEYTIPLVSSDFESSQPGELRVMVDSDAAFSHFFDRGTFLFLAGLVRNVILVMCLLVAFYWLLTRPLLALVEDIGNLEPHKLSAAKGEEGLIRVPPAHEKDELGRIAEKVNSFTKAIQDLLELRQLHEKQLLRSKEDIEQRADALQEEVKQREIAEQQAIQARENAELANRSKSEFLANMSHELRTPLNAVIGFSTIMKEEMFGKLDNAKYLDYCRDIHGASSHLLEVINDILDVSKIEVGEFKLQEKEFDAGEMIENTIRTMETTFQFRNQVIRKDIPAKPIKMMGDPVRVKQVLFNLLTNASKFTPEGGMITASVSLLPDNSIEFYVEDTGHGIPEKDHKRVFEAFAQVDNVFSRSHDGVGLGLSLCKSLVEKHDGSITLESEEGVGSKVIFTFPPERVIL